MIKNSFPAPVRSRLGEYLSLSPFIKETDECIAKLKTELPWLKAPRKLVVGMMVCLDIRDVLAERKIASTLLFKKLMRQRFLQLTRLPERTLYFLFSFWTLQKYGYVYGNNRNVQKLKKLLARCYQRYCRHSAYGNLVDGHLNNATYQEQKTLSLNLYVGFIFWLDNNI